MDYFIEALRAAFGLITSFDADVYAVAWTTVSVSLMACT
ncbi:ABC transporter permease, partial [bacterium]|nr:ABC transporter permease [bacterium]